MIKKTFLSAVVALGFAGSAAFAAGGEAHVEDFDFSFEGPFGSFDANQLQRGLQIYTEVCSACHGMKFVPIRTLADEGGPHLPEDQVRAYAANFDIFDPELDDTRPGTPVDHFPESALDTAPDLSLMAKKRAGFHGPYGLGINQFFKGMGGPEYIASLLTGYEEAPACAPEDFPGHYNTAFASGGFPESCKDEEGHATVGGSWIAMAPPLYGDDVTYNEASEMARKEYKPSRLLNYLDFSLDLNAGTLFNRPAWRHVWVGYSIHHRSAIFEKASQYGRIKGGSNYNTLYLQFDF